VTKRHGILAFGFLILFLRTHWLEMHGQAAPANDDSDWWSITRLPDDEIHVKIQQREISNANFRIAGVNLRDYSLQVISKVLGATPTTERGDASTGREQACYVSSDAAHPTYLIFEEGEVNSAFYLFSETTSWNGRDRCVRSKRVSRSIMTESGLCLGQTPEQVAKILGKPSERRGNALYYLLHVKKKTPLDQLTKIRTQHPELSDKEFYDDYGRYDFTVYICAKFDHAAMIYLGISVAETS